MVGCQRYFQKIQIIHTAKLYPFLPGFPKDFDNFIYYNQIAIQWLVEKNSSNWVWCLHGKITASTGCIINICVMDPGEISTPGFIVREQNQAISVIPSNEKNYNLIMSRLVLVTGSTGFIGSHLCRKLVADGFTVRAFHRPSSPLRLLEDVPVEHVTGDLTRPETISAAVKGVDAVFHCAALVGARMETGRLYTVIVEGTRYLLRAALDAGVQRLVYTSSMAAIGIPERFSTRNHQPAMLDENHTWNYRAESWPYAYAKYLAEQEIQQAVAPGLDAVIVNPTYVYGPGDVYRQRRSMITQVARSQVPFIFDGGLNVVHVQDVIAGHMAAMERGVCGERYILGGENLTISQLVEKIAAVAGVESPKLHLPVNLVRLLSGPINRFGSYLNIPASSFPLQFAGCYFYFNIRKAQTRLGLAEPIPADQAVQDSYDWYVKIGALTPQKTG